MDAMTVLVEAAPEAADEAAKSAAAGALEQRIKEIVGLSTQVVVGDPNAVERSQGKARRVVDKRPKG